MGADESLFAPTGPISKWKATVDLGVWGATEQKTGLRPNRYYYHGQAAAFSTNCGLPSVDVRHVLGDAGGRLWAVAGGQLGLFEGGRWRTPSALPPTSQTVRTITRARDGGLWVATGTVDPLGSRDLRIYKFKEGKWSTQLEPYPWPPDSQQFQRLALLEDQSGSGAFHAGSSASPLPG